MNRFKNILAVYSDDPGGDDVLVQAAALADANDANLTIFETRVPPCRAEVIAEARKRLRRIVPWIEQAGVANVDTKAVVGTPHVEIVRSVVENGHDLVVVGAESRRAIRSAFLRSLAAKLMLQCPSAVWVLKPGQSAPFANIVAALGLGGGERQGDELDKRILHSAASFARAHDARLHLVHFWKAEGGDDEMLRSEIHPDTRQRILQRYEAARRKALTALLDGCPTAPTHPQIHLPRGSADAKMAGTADRLSADLIVMGVTGRRGVSRLMAGDFCEAVLIAARCGVLTVKLDEFRAPIAAACHGSIQDREHFDALSARHSIGRPLPIQGRHQLPESREERSMESVR